MPGKNKAMFNVSGFVPGTYEGNATFSDINAIEERPKIQSAAVPGGIAQKPEALDRPEMNYDTP